MKQHFILAATFALAQLIAAPAAAEDIVIAQVAPLSGVLASTGQQMALGGKIYFDHVNAGGGVHGNRIKHVVKDDGYKTEETVRLTREAINRDGAVALFGFAGTGNISQLLEDRVLADAGIALVAPYTGGEALRSPFNPNIFHIRAGYADEVAEMVRQTVSNGLTRFAVFYQNDAFGKAGLDGTEAAVKKHGGTIIARATYEKNTDDVAEAAKAIAKAEPQAVIMVSVNKSTAAFVKQFRETGGAARAARLYSISVVNAAEMVRLVGADVMRGVGITQVMPSPHTGALPVAREYAALLRQYGPPDAELTYTGFEEFVGAKVLVEALRRAGPNPTRPRVAKALESMTNYDVGGFKVSYGPDNRLGSQFVELTILSRHGTLIK